MLPAISRLVWQGFGESDRETILVDFAEQLWLVKLAQRCATCREHDLLGSPHLISV